MNVAGHGAFFIGWRITASPCRLIQTLSLNVDGRRKLVGQVAKRIHKIVAKSVDGADQYFHRFLESLHPLLLVLAGAIKDGAQVFDKVCWDALREAAISGPPSKTAPILEHLELSRDFYNLQDPGFLDKAKYKIRVNGRKEEANYSATSIDESAGERWFCTEQEAQSAGWRKAGNCP